VGVALAADEEVTAFQKLHEYLGHIIIEFRVCMCIKGVGLSIS
jgi:hypothetical protein